MFKCCICKQRFRGYGNNPYPVNKRKNARCCDECDSEVVIPARIAEMFSRQAKEEKQ